MKEVEELVEAEEVKKAQEQSQSSNLSICPWQDNPPGEIQPTMAAIWQWVFSVQGRTSPEN